MRRRRAGRSTRWLAAVGLCLAGLPAASCGSSGSRAVGPPPAVNGGQIVIDFNNGGQNDSYTAVDPTSGTTRALGIPGYFRAGFNDTLTAVAIVRGGELSGSPADESSVGVSHIGSPTSRFIWHFIGSVNYPLAWNPGGNEVAIGVAASVDRGGNQYSRPSPGLWVLAADGSTHRQVVHGEVGPIAWSPDGKSLAYMAATAATPTALKVVSASGDSPRTIATLPPDIGGSYGDPTVSWSPDGRYLAVAYTTFVYATQQHSSQVALYPVSGGAPRVILGPSPDTIYEGASFSPDASTLAVAADLRPAISPPGNNPTETTLATSVPTSIPGQSLDIVNANGTGLHVIAKLNASVVMIGWYPGS